MFVIDDACISLYMYNYICIDLYKYIYIYTRNYALAIARASFPPGSHGNSLGITLGSRISKPKVMILVSRISVLNRFSRLFCDFYDFQSFWTF